MNRQLNKVLLLTLALGVAHHGLKAQNSGISLGQANQRQRPGLPTQYEIGGVTISGTKYLDEELLISISGLTVGDKVFIPADDKFTKAITSLWKQNLFSNLSVVATKFVGNKVFIDIHVTERPRLSRFGFKGITKSEAGDLKDKVGLIKGRVVTEATVKTAEEKIRKFYFDKGFLNANVTVNERPDTSLVNSEVLTFIISKGKKVHINNVNIVGNENVPETKLKGKLKGTKEMTRITLHPPKDKTVYGNNEQDVEGYFKNYGFMSPSKTLEVLDPYFRFKLFSSSKFNRTKFEEDKQALVEYYNSQGYRDAQVVADTTYLVKTGNMNVDMKIDEGDKYYFGDFSWRGNTKYSSEFLSKVLSIKRGDVYNVEMLDKRLGRIPSADGEDITSLYMDDGYLFFSIDPVETSINNDTINYEVRITEGPQATIKNIGIAGNDKTNEHVVRREIRTVPGNKFSRADIIRTQREIANLGFFNQEKIGIQPKPNQADGTVDIDYTLEEKSSDQLELSAGFGGGIGITGTLGVTFNNFSLRNIAKPSAWDPLPVGDGQKLSLRGQSNGKYYNSITFGFTEPWLGGKKPTALSVNLNRTFLSSVGYGSDLKPRDYSIVFMSVGASISKRLKWPDDNFVLSYGINYTNYNLHNYNGFLPDFNNGRANNLNFKFSIARYSVDQPLFPRSGSNIMFSMQFTPPYSAFNDKDYSTATPQEKYKLIEYHKYRFNAEWYQRVAGNLIMKVAAKYGFMGYYNSDIGLAPFERFQVGGDGLSGYSLLGRDIIAQRGYEVYSSSAGDPIFNKYTVELRYPFSLNPSSTIYGLAFAEAANSWSSFKYYNPFTLNRSAGVGVRVFLPMFGLLGLDYGVGFDRYVPGAKLKDMARISFMLGFEPE